MSRKLFLVAAEPSGDLLGREVAEELTELDHSLSLAGIGGAEMASIGLSSDIDTSPLSVLGFVEGLKAYSDVVRLADQACEIILSAKPDAVVLIDSWGFMLRVAQRLKTAAPKLHLIKLIGPQVWATRPGRAKTLAQTVDHVLCIHKKELSYYEPHGLKATAIGNPALGRIRHGDGAAFRARHGVGEGEQMLLVLPGSRRSEIAQVAPTLMDAAETISRELPNVRTFYAPAPSVSDQFNDLHTAHEANGAILTSEGERLDAMAAADLALACSGTVTTELAVQGAPMIVGYKTGWITWALARGLLYQPRHITLLNIMSDDQEIVPEYVQTQLKAGLIAEKAKSLLKDPSALNALNGAQDAALERMRADGVNPARQAAEAILADLKGI